MQGKKSQPPEIFLLAESTARIHNVTYEYDGEVDEKKRPCGFGVVTDTGTGWKVSGTWLWGGRHGISKLSNQGLSKII